MHHIGAPAAPADPWSGLDANGTGLSVDDFLTTRLSRVILAMRRAATQSYAQAFGLTVPQWRLLSVLAPAGTMPFADLVVQSTTDKALVSRTLRQMERRGLVALASEGSTPRKRLLCRMTPAGAALHAQVMPVAQQRQAELIHLLAPQERQALFGALRRLQEHCMAQAQPDENDGGA